MLALFLVLFGSAFGRNNIIYPRGLQSVGSKTDLLCEPTLAGINLTKYTDNIRVLEMMLQRTFPNGSQQVIAVHDSTKRVNVMNKPRSDWFIIMPQTFMTEAGTNLPVIWAFIDSVTCKEEGEYTCSVRIYADTKGETVTKKTESLRCLKGLRVPHPDPRHYIIPSPAIVTRKCCTPITFYCSTSSVNFPDEIKLGVYKAVFYRKLGARNSSQPTQLLASVNLKNFGTKLPWHETFVSSEEWDFEFPTEIEAYQAQKSGYPRVLLHMKAIMKRPRCDKSYGLYYCRVHYYSKHGPGRTIWCGNDLLECEVEKKDIDEDDDNKHFLQQCIFDTALVCCDLLCLSQIAFVLSVLILLATLIKLIISRTVNVLIVVCDINSTIKQLSEIVQCEEKVIKWVELYNLKQFGFYYQKITPETELRRYMEISRLINSNTRHNSIKIRLKMVLDKKRQTIFFVVLSTSQVSKQHTVPHLTASPSRQFCKVQDDPVKLHLRRTSTKVSELIEHGTPV